MYGATIKMNCYALSVKGEAIPLQAWKSPEGSRSSGLTDFKTIWHMKMVGLSALSTGQLYP